MIELSNQYIKDLVHAHMIDDPHGIDICTEDLCEAAYKEAAAIPGISMAGAKRKGQELFKSWMAEVDNFLDTVDAVMERDAAKHPTFIEF